MANKPIKIRIDVTKVLKQHLFKGKKGTYLNCVVWPKRDGKDEYGFTHSVKQELPKEVRDGGEEEPFIGDMSVPDDIPRETTRGATPASRPTKPAPADDDEDEIPF